MIVRKSEEQDAEGREGDGTSPLVTPHDRLFRGVFREASAAQGLLEPVLPAALTARIQWNTLRLEQSSYVDHALRWHHADLLFSVQCDGRPALIYVLTEHQSTGERFMALRLLGYLTKVLNDHLKRTPGATHLPLVISVVVSNAPRPWSDPVEMLDLFDLPEPTKGGEGAASLRSALAPALPSFRYWVDDLSATTEEAIQSRALSAAGTVALLALRHIRQMATFLEALVRWRALLQQLSREQLEQVLTYILELGDDSPEALADVLRSQVTEESGEVAMSTAERLRQEGRLEGRGEGEVIGVQRSLLLLMRQQFTEVPEPAQARIESASMDELVMWLGRVTKASTVAEVFREND